MTGVPYKKWGNGERQVIRFSPDTDNVLQVKDADKGAISIPVPEVMGFVSNLLAFMDKHIQTDWEE